MPKTALSFFLLIHFTISWWVKHTTRQTCTLHWLYGNKTPLLVIFETLDLTSGTCWSTEHTHAHTYTDLWKEQLNLRELILAKTYWNMKDLVGGGGKLNSSRHKEGKYRREELQKDWVNIGWGETRSWKGLGHVLCQCSYIMRELLRQNMLCQDRGAKTSNLN